jgi:hypothetical protein
MPQLKKTTYHNDHYHVVYIRDDGTGYTSPDEENQHSHEVEVQFATPEIINLETGQVVQEGSPQRIRLLESEGHTHEVIELQLEEKEDPVVSGDDEDLINEVHALFTQSSELEYNFRTRGDNAYSFYNGDQWDTATKQYLEANGRACITSNEIRPLMQALSGHQRQNRTDIKTFPIEDADPRGAELANIILKYVLDTANFAQHESKVFLDQIITGRGFFDVYVTFEDSSEGDIKIVRYKWDNIFLGPHDYEDCSDLEYLVKTKWYSQGKLSAMYPEKAEELSADMNLAENKVQNPIIDNPGDQYATGMAVPTEIGGQMVVDVQKKNFKILEMWRKRYEEVKVLINIEDSENEFIYDDSSRLSKEDFKKAKNIPGMQDRSVPKWQMEVITIAGKTLLDKRVSTLHDFNVVPVYASKEDDYVQGKVEPLIDLQKEINKRHSQAIDVVNRSNNDGWFFDDQTFASQEEENNFLDNCNTPGWAVKVTDLSRTPQKADRNRFPSELVNMMQLSSQKMREVSGISNEILGQESNAKSGVAIARRLRQGLTTNDYLFDNLSLAKKRLGKVLVKIIQDVFTVDRIMQILHDQNAMEPFQLTGDDGQQMNFSEIDPAFIRQFLENIDFTKYDISISESANSPTKNLDRFAVMTELMQSGSLNPISIDLAKQAGIVSPSDAEKYKQMLSQQSQQEMQLKQMDNQAQIARTVLAKDRDPNTLQPLPQGPVQLQ